MDRLKHIKETIVTEIEEQLDHLDCVHTKELGEAIDMVKDLEEAMYYCYKIKEMKEKEESKYCCELRHNLYNEEKHKIKLDEHITNIYLDILERVKTASDEEKIICKQKLTTLIQQIV